MESNYHIEDKFGLFKGINGDYNRLLMYFFHELIQNNQN